MDNPRFQRIFNIATLNLEERVRLMEQKYGNVQISSEVNGQLPQPSTEVGSPPQQLIEGEQQQPVVGGVSNQSSQVQS
jgi:hypothetical protein